MPPSDREMLVAWRRRGVEPDWDLLLGRYLAFVHASAWRRTGRADQAIAVTRAVFATLARRGRRLAAGTVLAGWLFDVTTVACRQINGRRRGAHGWFSWRPWKPRPESGQGLGLAGADHEADAARAMEWEAALEALPRRQREAVLLRTGLGWDWDVVAAVLRIGEDRARRRVQRGGEAMARRLRRRGLAVAGLDPGPAPTTPVVPLEFLAAEIAGVLEGRGKGRAEDPLARRTRVSLAWARWRRRVLAGVGVFMVGMLVLAWVFWQVEGRHGGGRLIAAFLIWSARTEARRVPGLAQEARPWPVRPSDGEAGPVAVRSAADFYQTTNLWPVHLRFDAAEWQGLEPRRIGALPQFFQPDGTVLLRHPGAQRSGLAGVLGYDFNWSTGDVELAGRTFTNAAVRVKGNGTYLASLHGDKRSFKADLNRHVKGQKLGGLDEFNFHNLMNDYSCLSDALGYEFFRAAGVPASRTAYAYLEVTVEGRWNRKPLGLYVMVEPVDELFAAERFGSKKTPLFKPVTNDLFHDLGDDWSEYAVIYDLKTDATPAQRRRLIEFARLVTGADDATFAARVGEFLDLERFARYLAVEVLLSNYDGFLSDGQNFHLYLDPVSNRFGFIPWDLDLSWGGFFLLGTARERERASIWHPWVGRHRFLERVMAVEEFRRLYRAQLEGLLSGLFVPERLHRRIDALAAVVRGPVGAESDFRRAKFEAAVGSRRRSPADATRGREGGEGADRPAHVLKQFIEARAVSVRQQLDGTSAGVILTRRPR